MTTIKVPASTLNFTDNGFLAKSELLGFAVIQQYKEDLYPDSYVAWKEDFQLTAKTLPELIASIIEHLYEKAI